MTKAQAQALVARIAAAFPRDWAYAGGAATNAVYVERLVRLDSYPAASDAVDSLIDTATRLPTVGQIRDEYRRYTDRYQPLGLPEPEVSEQARRENLHRVAELQARITRDIQPEHD